MKEELIKYTEFLNNNYLTYKLKTELVVDAFILINSERQDESQSVQHNEVKRKKCDSCGRTEGDTIANEYFCPKCGIYR